MTNSIALNGDLNTMTNAELKEAFSLVCKIQNEDDKIVRAATAKMSTMEEYDKFIAGRPNVGRQCTTRNGQIDTVYFGRTRKSVSGGPHAY